MAKPLETAFDFLPDTLRDELLLEYGKISNGFFEGKWEPSELSGGKFCEIVYAIIDGYSKGGGGNYPNHATKPQNMESACRNLANNTTLPDSLRLSVPRALIFLYDVRNRRGVGHMGGGSISPNHIDSLIVLNVVKWVLAELVRTLHLTSVTTASLTIESLATREIPLVWENNGVKRVLDTMSAKSQVLILLYSNEEPMTPQQLRQSIEYKNFTNFKNKVIKPLHGKRLIDFSATNNTITITPTGATEAEGIITRYR